MTDLDRKILARACGLCWHEWVMEDDYIHAHCKLCGKKGDYVDTEWPTLSFTTPDDWELVRVTVVVPHITINPSSFSNWICMRYSEYFDDSTEWILTMAPAECCQMVADFIKESPDLFPWVAEKK